MLNITDDPLDHAIESHGRSYKVTYASVDSGHQTFHANVIAFVDATIIIAFQASQ